MMIYFRKIQSNYTLIINKCNSEPHKDRENELPQHSTDDNASEAETISAASTRTGLFGSSWSETAAGSKVTLWLSSHHQWRRQMVSGDMTDPQKEIGPGSNLGGFSAGKQSLRTPSPLYTAAFSRHKY